MSVSIEKLKKEVDPWYTGTQIPEGIKDLCNIFTSINAIRYRLNQHDEVLRDFNSQLEEGIHGERSQDILAKRQRSMNMRTRSGNLNN